jgi:hypothetical protein
MHDEIMTRQPIEELLDVDREFRHQSRAILHTRRGNRRYSVLYSPTSLARRLRRDRDWVVIDLEEAGPNPHWTVVTERRGILKGKRVVRSREVECFWYYKTRRRPHRAA